MLEGSAVEQGVRLITAHRRAGHRTGQGLRLQRILGRCRRLWRDRWTPTKNLPPRDIMAPDSEPTDEELAHVMNEALAEALEQELRANEYVRQELARAVTVAVAGAGR